MSAGMTIPLKFDLKKTKVLPIWFSVILFTRMVITFTVFSFLQPISYLVIGLMCLNFIVISVLYIKGMKMSQYGLAVFMYMVSIAVFTTIQGTDIKTAFYDMIEVFSLLFIFAYYSNQWKTLLYSICLLFSIVVYLNLVIMIVFPDWMFAAEDEFDSFLLGGNRNQMGCRMMCAIISSILCTPYNKKWILNTIGVALISVITLLMVGSMNSISNIILFSLLCLIPSKKLLKYALVVFFAFYVLFQCLVCFQGEGLHNNELAAYLIQDVLGKDMTFTNRTEMWDAAAKKFAESPIIGWGRVDADWYVSEMNSFAIGPHNFIYSVLIYGGLVGMALFLLCCVAAMKRIWSYLDRTALLLLLGVVTFLFMMCFEVYKVFFVFYLFAMIYYYPDLYKSKDIVDGNSDISRKESISNE